MKTYKQVIKLEKPGKKKVVKQLQAFYLKGGKWYKVKKARQNYG